jgi:galactose mutarotase-like enzyme
MFDCSRAVLEKHSIDVRQFIDCRASLLANGMRIIDVHNSSGLTFSLLPDRGLDIWMAHYRGMPLTWISQASPHPPDHGSSWLRQFNGGLLVTCGLQHAGASERDPPSGEERGMHGRYTRLPAEILRHEGCWEEESYVLELSGRVAQSALFGEQLRLERTYRIVLGEPVIEIHDVVSNLADVATPFMLLYHFNFGYPLVRDGTRLDVAAASSHPRDETAGAGYADWERYGSSRPQYEEQVFYHHVLERDGRSNALLSNGTIGLMLTWDVVHAPYLTQWKNLRQGIYVSGLEPGNCLPEGQNAARAAGRLVELQPGEVQRFKNRIELFERPDGIARAQAVVEETRSLGRPVAGPRFGG